MEVGVHRWVSSHEAHRPVLDKDICPPTTKSLHTPFDSLNIFCTFLSIVHPFVLFCLCWTRIEKATRYSGHDLAWRYYEVSLGFGVGLPLHPSRLGSKK